MLGYVLIVLAGLAVTIQAIMGLLVTTRPPPQNRRLNYEIAFGTVGIIGFLSVVLSGIQGQDTEDSITAKLNRLVMIAENKLPKPPPPIATVDIPIAMPCGVHVGPDPKYPTKLDYANARTIDARVRLIVEELLLRRQRELILKTAVLGCGGDLKPIVAR